MTKRKCSKAGGSGVGGRKDVGKSVKVNDGVKPKGANKGKKKVNFDHDPDFEQEELEDSSSGDGYEDKRSEEDDSESSDGEGEDGEGDEQEDDTPSSAQNNKWQELCMQLLQERLQNAKRKGGKSVNKAAKKAKKNRGDVVKEEELVVKTQSRRTQKAFNLNGVKAFGSLVKQFDKTRKDLVNEMGFGRLLSMPLEYLPRKFAYWLLSRVDGDGSMVFGDEYVCPLCPAQVEWVLGIPKGSKLVPSTIPDDDEVMKVEMKRISGLFGKPGESIPVAVAAAAVVRIDKKGKLLPIKTDKEKAEFKIAFLVVALGYILYHNKFIKSGCFSRTCFNCL